MMMCYIPYVRVEADHSRGHVRLGTFSKLDFVKSFTQQLDSIRYCSGKTMHARPRPALDGSMHVNVTETPQMLF